MAHSRMYHFVYYNKEYRQFNEDTIYEETQHFADYVVEQEINEDEVKWLQEILAVEFGEKNVTRNELSFTIKKEGVFEYFERMRADLLNMLENSKDNPIEDFLEFNFKNVNWWRLKERIDSNFGPHFSIDDDCFGTLTNFADNIISCCKTNKTDSITLELKQIFDFHF